MVLRTYLNHPMTGSLPAPASFFVPSLWVKGEVLGVCWSSDAQMGHIDGSWGRRPNPRSCCCFRTTWWRWCRQHPLKPPSLDPVESKKTTSNFLFHVRMKWGWGRSVWSGCLRCWMNMNLLKKELRPFLRGSLLLLVTTSSFDYCLICNNDQIEYLLEILSFCHQAWNWLFCN